MTFENKDEKPHYAPIVSAEEKTNCQNELTFDLRFNNLAIKTAQPTHDLLSQSQDRMNTLFADSRGNSIVA